MSEELKPCPFCGHNLNNGGKHAVNCYINMLIDIIYGGQAAEKPDFNAAWNARATPPAVVLPQRYACAVNTGVNAVCRSGPVVSDDYYRASDVLAALKVAGIAVRERE